MKTLKLLPEDVNEWLQALADEHQIFGPVKDEARPELTMWARISTWDEITLTEGPPSSSVKPFYFPQPETLFTFSAKWNDPEAFKLCDPAPSTIPAILAGVRPCDARSIVLNSLPYKEDPYFQARLGSIAVIGLMCTHQCSTCFCRWVGGSPLSSEGMDVALYPLEGTSGLVAEAVTEKGERLLGQASSARQLAGSEAQFIQELKENEAAEMKRIPKAVDLLGEKELMQLYEAPFWRNIAETCINCGACTFLCPTCYCFDIQDETAHGEGRRIRYWDSCMFPLFTLHASGHNPRGEKYQRVRNRFMHKLKYFPDRFGPISCVGCGRCIKECPVNIDIREVIREMLGVAAR